MAGKNGTAKFGCCVVRWKDLKNGCRDSWEEVVSFRGGPELEHTDAVWQLAQAACTKKWKQTATSGWEVVETWMEAPHRW